MAANTPPGFEGVTPYLAITDADEAIAFYKRAFGATEDMRIGAGGMVAHAELTVFGGKVMVSEASPDHGAYSPKDIGATPVFLHLYVEDVDAVIEKACQEGAILDRPAQDQFYGDRSGMITDPYGHRWSFATHKEDLTPEEIQRRAKELFGQ